MFKNIVLKHNKATAYKFVDLKKKIYSFKSFNMFICPVLDKLKKNVRTIMHSVNRENLQNTVRW